MPMVLTLNRLPQASEPRNQGTIYLHKLGKSGLLSHMLPLISAEDKAAGTKEPFWIQPWVFYYSLQWKVLGLETYLTFFIDTLCAPVDHKNAQFIVKLLVYLLGDLLYPEFYMTIVTFFMFSTFIFLLTPLKEFGVLVYLSMFIIYFLQRIEMIKSYWDYIFGNLEV